MQTTCYAVAVALHYLFLVAFHWMAAEGVILYLVLVKVFQRKSANKDKRMFLIICWGNSNFALSRPACMYLTNTWNPIDWNLIWFAIYSRYTSCYCLHCPGCGTWVLPSWQMVGYALVVLLQYIHSLYIWVDITLGTHINHATISVNVSGGGPIKS